MPASTRGRLKDRISFVLVNSALAYGWASSDLAAGAGVSEADLTALGHMTEAAAMAASGVILVTGANAPRPARVTKKLPNNPITSRGSITTFVAYNAVTTARAAGFKISKQATSGPSLTGTDPSLRTIVGVVTLSNGLKVAQRIDPSIATEAARTALGIDAGSQVTTTDRLKLVRGAKSRPGRAQTEIAEGSFAVLPFSTDKETDFPLNWEILSRERVEYPAAAAPAGG